MARIVPPTLAALEEASDLLRHDKVCAFPTETVYGLGSHALSVLGIQRIYDMKGRPANNPLIVHVASANQVPDLVSYLPDVFFDLAELYWPGPLTLVLPRAPHVPASVSAGLSTVAIRVPRHPVAQALLRTSGLPICAPSANRSEGISPTCAEHVAQSLPLVPLILDGGPCAIGIESTIVDITVDPPRLLRPGGISVVDLRFHIPNLQLPLSLPDDDDMQTPRSSPGQMKRHYAPKAQVLLFTHPSEIDWKNVHGPIGCMIQDSAFCAAYPFDFVEKMPEDPVGYAADLYAALHRLDAQGVQTIVIQWPPDTEHWMAIHDRLTRAAAN